MSNNLNSFYDKTFLVRKPLLLLLIIAIILPYQIGVVQLQPIISLLLLLYIILISITRNIKIQPSYFYLLSFIFIITLYSTAISALYFSSDNLIKLVSGLHNHICLFLVMFALCSTSIDKIDIQKEINFLAKLLVLLITINFITQIMQIFTPDFSNKVLLFFNSSFTVEKTTFQFSQRLGRYSGLFNVSIVAGYLSIIGVIFLAHQFSKLSLFYKLSLSILLFSGLLTLSKVFILGIIISIIVLLIYKQKQVLTYIFFIGALGLLFICLCGQADYLSKSITYFNFIFDAGFNTQLFLRYGSSSHNGEIFSTMSMAEILFGQGFPTIDSIDSGLLWYLLQGGLVVLFFVAIFFITWFLTIKVTVSKKDQFFVFLCYLMTLIAFVADPINVMKRSSFLFALIIYYTTHLSKISWSSAEHNEPSRIYKK